MSPFTIPNEAAAAFADQAEVDAVDVDILVAGYAGTGVISGCAVTAQAVPDMSVAVASGEVSIAGTQVAVAAGSVVVGAADATNGRFDLVVVDNAGTKSVVAGAAGTNPAFPAIPANSVVLAAIYIPATDTAINSNQITDKRVVLTDLSAYQALSGKDVDGGYVGRSATGFVTGKRTHSLWIPPLPYSAGTSWNVYGRHAGSVLSNTALSTTYFSFALPSNFSALTRAVIRVLNGTFGTGNMYAKAGTHSAGDDQFYSTFSDESAYAATSIATESPGDIDISGAFDVANLATAQRQVGVVFTRDATNAADTIDNLGGLAACLCLGLWLEFTTT